MSPREIFSNNFQVHCKNPNNISLQYYKIMKKKLDLIPPGNILQEEFMKPLEITAYRLSKDIKVQQTAVSCQIS